MRMSLMAASFAATLAFAANANATEITFNFNTPQGNRGSSETYSIGSSSVTAYAGYYNTALPPNVLLGLGAVLYGKNDGAGEQGLGVCQVNGGGQLIGSTCDSDPNRGTDEIDHDLREVIQLDIRDLLADGYSTFKVNADSTTQGEALAVYTSSTSGKLGTLIATITSGVSDILLTGVGSNAYLNFISATDCGGENVLLHSLTASSVPEPATLAMLGIGLAGIGLIRRRHLTA